MYPPSHFFITWLLLASPRNLRSHKTLRAPPCKMGKQCSFFGIQINWGSPIKIIQNQNKLGNSYQTQGKFLSYQMIREILQKLGGIMISSKVSKSFPFPLLYSHIVLLYLLHVFSSIKTQFGRTSTLFSAQTPKTSAQTPKTQQEKKNASDGPLNFVWTSLLKLHWPPWRWWAI